MSISEYDSDWTQNCLNQPKTLKICSKINLNLRYGTSEHDWVWFWMVLKLPKSTKNHPKIVPNMKNGRVGTSELNWGSVGDQLSKVLY